MSADGMMAEEPASTSSGATMDVVEVSQADLAGFEHDLEMVESMDRLLTGAATALAEGDHEGAWELLADAYAALDLVGALDPDRPAPPERRLGSRLRAVQQGIARARDAQLDAMIARPG